MRNNTMGLIEETGFPWLEILDALFRRRRAILSVTLAGLLLATLVAWLQPNLYKAKTKIQLTDQALSGPRVNAMTEKQILAEMDLLKSPALLRIMFERESETTDSTDPEAGIRRRLREFFLTPKRLLSALSPVAPIDQYIRKHAKRIDVNRVQNTNVVQVAYVDEDPERAAAFVNDLLVHHIDRIASLGEGTGARSFYETQVELLAEKWNQANAELLAFRRRHGATASEREIQDIISRLESQRVAAETQTLELQANIAFLTEQLERVPETVAGELLEKPDGSLGLLTSRLLELQIKRIDLLATYTPESKVVRDLDRQIADIQALIESNESQTVSETMTEPNPSHQAVEVQLLKAESSLNAAYARLKALDVQIANYQQKLAQMEGFVAELSTLQSAVDAAKEDHQTYLKQTERARLESALDAAGSVNVTIIEGAEVPLSPQPSMRQWIVVYGTLLSLVMGLVWALAADFLNPTVKSGLQLERLTGLPVIAEMSLEAK